MVAYRNGCSTNCPLLIILHGAGGDGQKMAADSQIYNEFTGIIAFPSSIPFATGWPILANNDTAWNSNMQVVRNLIDLPDVDPTRVFTLGFSSGGFYSYALACAMGDELRAAVVVSALKYVQPACPHVTNILHIHSAHDNYNVPTDPANGTKPGGAAEIGRPATLRDNWLDRLPAGSDATTNGRAGVTSGAFTLFSAAEGIGNLTYSYWSYLTGPERHAYIVYGDYGPELPAGAPGGVQMEAYIATYLEAHAK